MTQVQTYFNDCWLEEDAFKSCLVKRQIKSKPDVDYVRKISSFLIWVKRHSLVMLPVKSIVKEI